MKWMLLATLFLTGCANAHPQPVDPSVFALRIVSQQGEAGQLCGATAIGPNEIETAQHCLSYPLVTINDKPVRLVRFVHVAEDRVRVIVSGVTFDHWAKHGKARQGDRVRWWGQPLGHAFVYREGVIAKVYTDGLMVDATICKGDSGSGLFNDAGELVGVVSFMSDPHGCTFLGAR